MSATLTSAPTAEPTTVDLLFPDFAAEHAATRRLLARFPERHASWRPHARSRTLAELATHVAELPQRGVAILTTDGLDAAARGPLAPVATAADVLALHDASVAQLTAALADADDAALAAEWVLRAGPHVLIRGPKRVLLRTVMMSHLIHHRAQLGVYYRLLGVPIPGMYGPSADDHAAGGGR